MFLDPLIWDTSIQNASFFSTLKTTKTVFAFKIVLVVSMCKRLGLVSKEYSFSFLFAFLFSLEYSTFFSFLLENEKCSKNSAQKFFGLKLSIISFYFVPFHYKLFETFRSKNYHKEKKDRKNVLQVNLKCRNF